MEAVHSPPPGLEQLSTLVVLPAPILVASLVVDNDEYNEWAIDGPLWYITGLR